MTSLLKARCPVWIDPEQYCDQTDYYKYVTLNKFRRCECVLFFIISYTNSFFDRLFCKPRKTYDGHFHEKPIRDRLKPIFDPKDCLPPYRNEPMPLCIQQN